MKYIINERQYKMLMEQDNDILRISFNVFNNNWDFVQKFLEKRGNPPYIITDDLNLRDTDVKSLGNLISVEGYLSLYDTPIESLGNLTSVGGSLFLGGSPIESLGNLTSVGSSLFLENTPLSKKYTKDEIRSMVEVGGDIYF